MSTKPFCTLFLAASLAPAVHAVTLTIDSVRQCWPFSPKVDIAFTVAGADGDYYALKDFKVFDGARAVDHPGVFAFEGVRPAYGDGSYTITYDPSRSLLTNTVAVQRFRVSFDITPQPVRYLILDLAKRAGEPGAVEYICSGDARLESFEQKVDYLDADGTTPRQTTITYDEAFLAVTNRTFSNGNEQQAASPYALTKMAFRLVKPGTYRVGKESIASDGNDVTFTKPYFISVFKLTHGQYGCMRYGDWRRTDSEVTGNPSEQAKNRALYLDDLRGQHGDAAFPVDWIQYGHAVCPTSFVGRARAKYGFGFDLATEAQWEVACRAGAAGLYGDKDSTAANTNLLLRFASPKLLQKVGNGRLPNAWGLYDMLGNCGEVTLDALDEATRIDGVDPTGPGSLTTDRVVRGLKGGDENESVYAKYLELQAGYRAGLAYDGTGIWTTYRFSAMRWTVELDD